tara:strand:+ start:173 stop:595 length:423 start_codon:yes stop_codon:yes gene_type:complete
MATLKTNTLTGTSTAGSIAVTGEGGSTTTNLQQGLPKVVGGFNQQSSELLGVTAGGSTRFGLNVASYTDTATSIVTTTFTNPFSDLEYITVGSSLGDRRTLNVENGTSGNNTTSKRDTRTFNNSGEFDSLHYFTHFGGLA